MRTTLFKGFFIFVLLLILGTIAIRAKMVMNANGKTLYQIDVNNFNSHESYITTDYTRDKETGCITFKDEFGLKHVVCNSYSITEY